jgi:Spy/CpxP family protein refolding chaperone
MKHIRTVFATLLLVGLVAAPVFAQPGQGRGFGPGRGQGRGAGGSEHGQGGPGHGQGGPWLV